MDVISGLPLSKKGGFAPATGDLHEYWDEGLLPTRFNVNVQRQKGSKMENVELLLDQPVGVVGGDSNATAPTTTRQNILRLHAKLNTTVCMSCHVVLSFIGWYCVVWPYGTWDNHKERKEKRN